MKNRQKKSVQRDSILMKHPGCEPEATFQRVAALKKNVLRDYTFILRATQSITNAQHHVFCLDPVVRTHCALCTHQHRATLRTV